MSFKFDLHPTPSVARMEHRLDRIDLGREARCRLRQWLACPFCGKIHDAHARALLAFIDDESYALREAWNDEMARADRDRRKMVELRRKLREKV
jgi:Mg2+ and Co2+ transporter CorA